MKNNWNDVSRRHLEFPISEGTKKPGHFFAIEIEDIPGIENIWILLRRTTCSNISIILHNKVQYFIINTNILFGIRK